MDPRRDGRLGETRGVASRPCFCVVQKMSDNSKDGLGRGAQRALAVLLEAQAREGGPIVVRDEWLAEAVGASRSSAQRYFGELLRQGFVEVIAREFRGRRVRTFERPNFPRQAKGCDAQRPLDFDRRPAEAGDATAEDAAIPAVGQQAGEDGPTGPESGPMGPPGFSDTCWHALNDESRKRATAEYRETLRSARREIGNPDLAKAREVLRTRAHEDLRLERKNQPNTDMRPKRPAAEAALRMADSPEEERLAQSIWREAQDPALDIGFCRKLSPILGTKFPEPELRKIFDRLKYRRSLPVGHEEALTAKPWCFFTACVMQRFLELTGSRWPRSRERQQRTA